MTVIDEAFLSAFFSAPNLVWPNRDPNHASAAYLAKFLPALSQRGEIPLVLPRKEAGWPVAQTYVLCWSRAHAGRIRTLLSAAVGENWCDFDGRLAHLRPGDPIDAAVLSVVGPGTTYILRPPNARAHNGLFGALGRLVLSLEQRPLRTAHLPRPIGRLLRDFEVSLAAGQALTSLELLNEIERSGGVSLENVAFLRIRRLGQLGADDELLSSPGLGSVVATEPPRLVRESILAAWYRTTTTGERGTTDLVAHLATFGADIALLADETIMPIDSADAWAACAVVAVARGDVDFARALLGTDLHVPDRLRAALRRILGQDVSEASATSGHERAAPAEPSGPSGPSGREGEAAVEPEARYLPGSWLDWIEALGNGVESEFSADLVEQWLPPGEADSALAAAIDLLPEPQVPRVLEGLGAFLDADDYSRPAWRAAGALVRLHLVSDSLTPSDLGAISALLAIFLRGAPMSAEYGGLLNDLADFRGRWSSVATAAPALDIADLVVCAPASSTEARQSFIAAALDSLLALRHRLPDSLRTVAELATADVGLGWDWTVERSTETVSDESPRALPRTLLLYSLDEAVLARASTAVGRLYPSVRVEVSSAKVGNDALREHSRNADLIVLATRRATHAATGFIQSNAGSARIAYADGCGSGSMVRAIEDGIKMFM